MKHHLSIDLETFSSVSIKKAGAQAYLRSQTLKFCYSPTALMAARLR